MSKNNVLTKLNLVIAVCVAMMLLISCGKGGASSGKKIKVTTTTTMLTDLVKTIGGDKVEVTGLMGEGVDPHLYSASAGDIEKLGNADIIVYGGLHLEGKMTEIFEKLTSQNIYYFTLIPISMVLFLLIPILRKKESREKYLQSVFSNFVTTGIFAAVLWIGIEIILATVNYLFFYSGDSLFFRLTTYSFWFITEVFGASLFLSLLKKPNDNHVRMHAFSRQFLIYNLNLFLRKQAMHQYLL